MLHAVLTVLHLVAGAAAFACWTLGMYFWFLLDYAAKPTRPQRKRRMVLSFVAMLIFGAIAVALRLAKESMGGT